jgi:hypothetical protein
MDDLGRHGAMRGFRNVYRMDETNHCPGCDQSNWMVGRTMAECAFCATALPLLTRGGAAKAGISRTPIIAPLAA